MKYEETAKRIREAMSDLGISQQELADLSKIGKSSISHYVNGTNEPGNKAAYMMAQVLNVNPGWLMGLDVPKESIVNLELNITHKNDNDNKRALELYDLYLNANKNVQDAIDSLLRVQKSDS